MYSKTPLDRCPVSLPSLLSNLLSSRRARTCLAATACVLLAMLLATATAVAATQTVNTLTDSNDGSCGTTCSLRDAITAASAGDIISFSVTGTITLTSALPAISKNLTITGPGANVLTVSGAGSYQVFDITSGTVAISGMTIANGATSTGGGGIAVASGATLQVTGCVFADNKSTSTNYGGGAILNSGTLTVTGSTFYGNSEPSQGGGAIENGVSSTTTVTNSTFYGNSAFVGGAIVSDGVLTVTDSTFADNSGSGAGGAIAGENVGTTWTLTNNIFAGNSAPTDGGIYANGVSGTESYNLFFNNSNGDSNVGYGTGDVHGTDPKLLRLEDYGGTTPTMLPAPGSSAIGVGTATLPSPLTLPSTDQRGFTLDSAAVDIGAVQTNYQQVTSSADSGAGTLRAALTAANTAGTADIDFASSLNGSTITLASALPAITGQVNIAGLGANALTISGNNSTTVGSVLTVNSGSQVSLYGLTIANGSTNGVNGGGINNSGTLSLIDCGISGNTTSSGTGTLGGGIYSTDSLTIVGSSVSGNVATGMNGGGGGGIYSNGSLIIINSTISGNNTSTGGGIESDGTAALTNVTVSGNRATSSIGGVDIDAGTATIANSIVAGNTAGTNPDISGTYTDKGGNQVGTAVNLAPLGNYGGLTHTMLPLPGSPALCAGTASLAVDAYGNAQTTDQRGFALSTPSYCAAGQVDSGAVQTNYQSIQFTNGTNGYGVLVNTADVTPVPVVSVTENGQNVGGVPITLTFTPTSGTPTVTNLGPVTTVAGTGATFGSLTGGSTAGSGTLSAPLSLPVALTTASTPTLDVETTFLVTPAAGPLTAGTVGAAYNLQFGTTGGGRAPYTFSVTSGSLPAGLTLTANSGVLSGTPTAGGSSSFTIQAKDKHGYTGSTSYTLTINPTAPTVSVNQPVVAYGASGTIAINLTGPSGAAAPTGTVSYTIDGGSSQNATLSGGVASLLLPATLAPGSHTILWNYGGDTNYVALANQTITQTISAAVLTISVNSFSRAYGAGNPTLTGTVTGLQNGDTAASVGLAYSTTATTNSPAGTYSINATITSANYSLNVTQGTLTVTAAPLTVAVNSFSRAYGAANPTLTGSASGFQNGDTASSVGLTYSTTATAVSAVGTYSITPSITSTNYSLNVTAGTLTVTAAPLTVAASSFSRVYGAANPTFTGTATGLQGSDTASSVGLTYSTTATASSAVGTYPITASITSANYSLSLTAGTLTVTSAPLSVTANSSSRVYGAANPTFTGTVTGLLGSDTASSVGLTYSTTATASSPVGTYPITAAITSANYTLSVTPGTLTVGKSDSAVTVSSLTGPSIVNQSVTFSAAITSVSGTGTPTGTVTFTDVTTGSSLCTATISSGQATCVTASLRVGNNQSIQAAYSGDSNYNAGSGAVTVTVSPAASSLALTSSLNPSVVLNPQNTNDAVNLVAAVSPTGPVPLSGSVIFTDNGAPIAECQAAVAVNPSTGVASCVTKSLGSGTHTILAVYNSDSNYTSSRSSITQQVEDYSLTTSTSSVITISQGFTNGTDPFTPQALTVSATPLAGFTGNLAMSCNVVAVSVPTGAVVPSCSLASKTLAIVSGSTPQPVSVTIDAGSGSNPRATPGGYSISITGVDATTGLTRVSASVPVGVRSEGGPLTIQSGSTTGNAVMLDFTLPANVGLASLQCISVSGPTLTSSVAPIALGMGCTFDPSTIAAASTIQGATVTVTINTGLTTTARLRDSDSGIVAASLLGLPILLLLGLMPGGKSSRKVLCRFLVVLCAVIVLLQGTGCGGGHFTAPPSVSGQTPPGSYNILVQGTGTDNHTYEAVIQLNVTR